jgi:hypothetical protein
MKNLELASPSEMSASARAGEIAAILATAIVRTLAGDDQEQREVGLGFLSDQCVHTTPYDVENRKLVINAAEAAIVRRIFEEMLTIGSPTRIAANLTAEGITTKAWTTQEGQARSD